MKLVLTDPVFGLNIRYLRYYYWMSRRTLAWLIDIPVSDLRLAERFYMWLAAGLDFPYGAAKRIADIFHVDVNDLLTKSLCGRYGLKRT